MKPNTELAHRARDGRAVTLRPATLEDAWRMFEWQNDDRTRKHARNPAKPCWDEHLAWLARYLASSGHLFVIEHCGEAAGSLRLDPRPQGGFEISIVTDPKKYRVGVAVPALALARAHMPDAELHAEILEGNEASRRMLVEAGYQKIDPCLFVQRPAR